MRTRKRGLPYGWYPGDDKEVEDLLAGWVGKEGTGALAGAFPGGAAPGGAVPGGAVAAVAPHAGWAFSGRLAALAVSSLSRAETVVVIGGHLPAGMPVLAAAEDAIECPGGQLAQDLELRKALASLMDIEEDRSVDNTVEVQLPLVRAIHPGARILWLRAPAGPTAMELGTCLDSAARSLGRRIACLGSTDLTHYGPDYGFEPAGRGPAAEAWVREKSDKGFIDALLGLDAEAALARGTAGAACSSGAAVAAMGFALARGAGQARLLAYATSLEVRRASSFVGYCAVGFY